MAAPKKTAIKSIQATPKRGYKRSGVAELQAKTLAKAYRQGATWDDTEVATLVAGIEKDLTTYELALSLGRSYYGVAGARAHVGFALRHKTAIYGK
jgi:hypothetical protein